MAEDFDKCFHLVFFWGVADDFFEYCKHCCFVHCIIHHHMHDITGPLFVWRTPGFISCTYWFFSSKYPGNLTSFFIAFVEDTQFFLPQKRVSASLCCQVCNMFRRLVQVFSRLSFPSLPWVTEVEGWLQGWLELTVFSLKPAPVWTAHWICFIYWIF